jgi:predicted permease
MQRADLGMQPDHLAGIPVRFAGPEFKDSTARRNAFKNILARVRSTPGIEAATVTLSLPPDFAAGFAPIEIEGRPFVPSDSMKAIAFNFGKPDMFRVAGLRFLQGRPFLDDARLRGEAGATEVVINERFARRFWPDGKALGARIKRMDTWATVVGVVANLDVPGTKGLPSGVQLYQSMSDAPVRFVVLVKSRLPGPQLEPLLRDAIREASPRATIGRYADADAQVQHGRIVHRFILSLIGGFSILALVLAAIGLHAVISYSVTQRLREIGIRMALGARTGQVANLVLRQGVSLTSAGIVVGAIGGWAAARAMRSLLYGVEPGDPLTMAVVALALVATAVMASMLPARRATRVDPVEMIRVE